MNLNQSDLSNIQYDELKDGTITKPQAATLSEEKSRDRKIDDFFDNKKKKKTTFTKPLTEEIEVSSEEEVKTSGASNSQPIAFKFVTKSHASSGS